MKKEDKKGFEEIEKGMEKVVETALDFENLVKPFAVKAK